MPILTNPHLREGNSSPAGSLCTKQRTKIMLYFLSISIKNKRFKFQNNSLKKSAFGTIGRYFALYIYVKEIEKFEQQDTT